MLSLDFHWADDNVSVKAEDEGSWWEEWGARLRDSQCVMEVRRAAMDSAYRGIACQSRAIEAAVLARSVAAQAAEAAEIREVAGQRMAGGVHASRDVFSERHLHEENRLLGTGTEDWNELHSGLVGSIEIYALGVQIAVDQVSSPIFKSLRK